MQKCIYLSNFGVFLLLFMTSPYRIFPLILSICLLWTSSCVYAQSNIWDNAKSTGKKTKATVGKKVSGVKKLKDHIKQWGLEEDYNKGLLVGGRLNSNGWSGGLYYMVKNKPGVYGVWQLHFSEIKHEKQVKQQATATSFKELGDPTPFVYGKINNLYTLQLGYGQEQVLLPGVVEGNMSVGFRWNAGFSLAMLKPYYQRLIHVDYSQPEPVATLTEEKYSEENAELFLKSGYTLGASKWSKGLDEMKYIPGVYADAAVVIIPAPSKGVVQTITLGVNAAIYTKPLPIMAEVKAYPFKVALFAGLAIGKKWK